MKGERSEYIVQKILNENNQTMGYDAKSKRVTDMLKQNIIDPVKNVKAALRYGGGVASILLTAEVGVIEEIQSRRDIHE